MIQIILAILMKIFEILFFSMVMDFFPVLGGKVFEDL